MEQAKRGFVPSDQMEFNEKSLEKLRVAARHIRYLINEGYGIKSASAFVGNHFLLSERQRLSLVRSISTDCQISLRRQKELREEDLAGQTVYLDGFNVIITLEVALSGSPLFLCMDGTIRDLAGLRGTYRLIDVTREAVTRILAELLRLRVKKAVFYLDSPVSNSGRLKGAIAEIFENQDIELDIIVIYDVDRRLMELEAVITADAIILDHCKSWFNLTKLCRTEAEIIRVWEND